MSAWRRPNRCLTGPTAVTFCFGELAAPAKTLGKWAKDTKILVVRGGMIGQSVFDEAGVQALSELPGRISCVRRWSACCSRRSAAWSTCLAGPMRGFLTVLNARIGQLEQAA